ncbi:hypothetical protein JOM56_011167 [Amanita muscaria]
MHKKASNARSDDTKALKKEIARYLPYDLKNDVLTPPFPVSDGKLGKSLTRGFYHKVCAQNLCPRRLLDQFDIDPKTFMDAVLNGEMKIKDKDFPSFLYDEAIPYDPHNKDAGLLKALTSLHEQAYRHIITGPRTALNPDLIKAKNSRCKRKSQTEFPSHVVNQTGQVYYALAAADNWGPVLSDGFNLQGLYNRVVRFLEKEEDSTVKGVLEWYDTRRECHFHELKRKQETKESETETDTGDELEEIEMSRGVRQRNANRAKSVNLPHNKTSAPVDTQDAEKEFSLDVADSQRDETVELDNLDFPQSTYVGNQLGFDSQDEIEASAGSSVGPLTPLTYPESQYDIPNGLNISNQLSFNPNFVNFNPGPNGSFFLQPNGMTNLQSLNGFVPNGFNLEGLKSNGGMFFLGNGNNQYSRNGPNSNARTENRRYDSEADSEEDRIPRHGEQRLP